MKKSYKSWLSKDIPAKIYFEEQTKCSKQIYPQRQAVIGEETISLDEEHIGHPIGHTGEKGINSFRGAI